MPFYYIILLFLTVLRQHTTTHNSSNPGTARKENGRAFRLHIETFEHNKLVVQF